MAQNQKQEQDKHKEQPIIIKKIKKGGHGHHGGAWKVAYADFVTAMMAFFIVMWILASSEEVKQSVEAYAKDPMSFSIWTGEPKGDVLINLNMYPDPRRQEEQKDVFLKFDQKATDTISLHVRHEAIEDSISAAQRVESVGNELKKRFKELIVEKPDLEVILSSIKIELTNEGLRIELIESTESLFFELGSAVVKPQAREVLSQLAREIGKLPNYVEIEGHTDSRPYGSGATYTNWNLSADRANSARVILEVNGFWPGQVTRITGFADNKLRTPDNPFDITNRRVSILIKQFTADDFLDNFLN
jgi:chemotaxis protein MotB